MTLAAFGAALLLMFAPAGGLASARLDLLPVVRIELEQRVPVGRGGGLATPFGYVVSRAAAAYHPCLELEEQTHARQAWALGVAWPLAYALTWGEPFEPYDVRAAVAGPVACANVRRMWGAAEPARVPPVSVAWCADGARARVWPLVAGCAP